MSELSPDNFKENPEDLIKAADELLADMGLSLSDLRSKKLVLDLGAGHGILEKGARALGLSNVVSADRDAEYFQETTELAGRTQTNARALPFRPDSFDLIICRAGPIPMATSAERAKLALTESNFVLAPNGQINIYPPFFRFIHEQRLQLDTNSTTEAAQTPSAEFLEELGYQNFVRQNNKGETFWVLPKLT